MIGIDAGHGGQSRGTWIKDGPDEADYVLTQARRLQVALHNLKIKSVLLRDSDQNISLPARGRLARTNACALVMSLHVNACPGDAMHGLSCWHWPGNARTKALGQQVLELAPPELSRCPRPGLKRARPLVEAISEWDLLQNERWRHRGRAVLRHYSCDALLIEFAFGATDYKALLDIDVQTRLAAAFAQAIDEETNHGRNEERPGPDGRTGSAGDDAGRRSRNAES